MPTGYTSEIENGISFEKFTLNCARAFGALMSMREDPLDKEIPDSFEPSDYNLKELEEAKQSLAEFNGLTTKQKQEACDKMNKDSLVSWENSTKKYYELKSKYESMLAEVLKWNPPTKYHDGLKSFMADQIKQSIKFDCYFTEKPKPISLGQFIESRTETLNRNIKYHSEAYEKEVKSCNERSEWVQKLKQSLK